MIGHLSQTGLVLTRLACVRVGALWRGPRSVAAKLAPLPRCAGSESRLAMRASCGCSGCGRPARSCMVAHRARACMRLRRSGARSACCCIAAHCSGLLHGMGRARAHHDGVGTGSGCVPCRPSGINACELGEAVALLRQPIHSCLASIIQASGNLISTNTGIAVEGAWRDFNLFVIRIPDQ